MTIWIGNHSAVQGWPRSQFQCLHTSSTWTSFIRLAVIFCEKGRRLHKFDAWWIRVDFPLTKNGVAPPGNCLPSYEDRVILQINLVCGEKNCWHKEPATRNKIVAIPVQIYLYYRLLWCLLMVVIMMALIMMALIMMELIVWAWYFWDGRFT